MSPIGESESTSVGTREQRHAPRFRASFPMEVGEDGGLTIDISACGVAFESARKYEIGEDVAMRLRVDRKESPWPMSLECRGRVVRVQEEKDGVFTVAATVEWVEDEVPEFTVE